IEMNFRLRMAIDQARQANMPGDTIERAVLRASGDGDEANIQSVLYEAFSPGRVAMLIVGATDNPNRAVADVRHAITKHGGRLGEQGSVRWMFEQVGVIHIPKNGIPNRDALELALIDAGAEDIQDESEDIIMTTSPETLGDVLGVVTSLGITPTSAETTFLVTNPVDVDDATREKLQALADALLDLDDVQNVYTAT
ncbi:MAG: YebC/PmpR family DNA-binding transcriptional regulator, partial [Sideroxyarcus sp.]|nr:YebC/PmpR family DNA-binding transcriptional regulator [Sideroxyarcus sp.]